MVGPEKDDGFLVEPGLLYLVNQLTCPGIHRGDQFIITLPVLPRDRRVRVIGRQGCQLCRILSLSGRQIPCDCLVFCLRCNATLVTSGIVENRKERLVFSAFFPVGPGAGFVPDVRPGGFRELVICLGVIRAVITGIAQEHRERLKPFGQNGITAHVVCPYTVLVHPGNDPATTGCTDTC